MEDSRNQLLLVFKFLLGNINVVLLCHKQWLNESEELIRDRFVIDDLMQGYNCLTDLCRNLPPLCEWQVLHQVGVLIHSQY